MVSQTCGKDGLSTLSSKIAEEYLTYVFIIFECHAYFTYDPFIVTISNRSCHELKHFYPSDDFSVLFVGDF